MGLALHNFQLTYGVFPTNGGYDGGAVYMIKNDPSGSCTNDACKWGVGRPGLSPQDQTGSWAYSILPFLEQDAVHDLGSALANGGQGVGLKLFICPTRGRQTPQTAPPDDPYYIGCNYRTVPAGMMTWSKSDYACNGQAIFGRHNSQHPPLRITDVTDGTSNTILLGEKAMDSGYYNVGGWNWDEPIFSSAGGTRRTRGVIVQDRREDPPDIFNGFYVDSWGSAHPGGAQFLLFDGSVRLLSYGLPGGTVTALMTPQGGEVIPPLD
jgi:prepilin-type processing-associated H-X9-DG protein